MCCIALGGPQPLDCDARLMVLSYCNYKSDGVLRNAHVSKELQGTSDEDCERIQVACAERGGLFLRHTLPHAHNSPQALSLHTFQFSLTPSLSDGNNIGDGGDDDESIKIILSS